MGGTTLHAGTMADPGGGGGGGQPHEGSIRRPIAP